MEFPKKILQKLEEITKVKRQEKVDLKNSLRRKKRAAELLDDLKNSRILELIVAATKVSNWLKAFFRSKDGKKLFRQIETIDIFCASFWQGLPAPEAGLTTFATIGINRSGKVFYAERYKAFPQHLFSLGKIPIKPKVLVEKLHPDYLTKLCLHLESQAVWDYIEFSMPKKV